MLDLILLVVYRNDEMKIQILRHRNLILFSTFSGDPLYVGFDLTIASFDSISEVSMVSNTRKGDSTLKQEQNFLTSCLSTNFLRLNYYK